MSKNRNKPHQKPAEAPVTPAVESVAGDDPAVTHVPPVGLSTLRGQTDALIHVDESPYVNTSADQLAPSDGEKKTDEEIREDISQRTEALSDATSVADNALPAAVTFVIDKDPTAYSDEVLREFYDVMTVDQRVIFAEILRQRHGYHAGWSASDCWGYFLGTSQPKATENGFWKDDPDRQKRVYTQWTAGELAAAIIGEIDAPEFVTKENLAVALRRLVVGQTGDVEAHDWVVNDLVRWALYGQNPKRSVSGVRLWSVTRERATARGWSDEELKAFVLGEIPSTDNASDAELYSVAAQRLGASIRYTREALEAFVCDGTVPARTIFGVLVDDAFRNELPVDHWSFLELVSGVRGEINVPDNIDVKAAYIRRTGMSANAAGVLTEQLLKLDKVELPMAIEFVSNSLNKYAELMDTKKAILPAVGGSTQVGLLRTINKILRLEGKDFHEGWAQLLAFVAEHRDGLFHEYNAFRFMAEMNASATERKQFNALMDLILHSCRPADRRQVAKIVDIKKLGEVLANDNVMQRLISFYEI